MKKRFINMLQKTVAMAMAAAVLGMLPMGQVSAANANGAIAQGVDASKHNGAVNWGQVAASGMQFAFIKVGSTYSGVDPQFATNITGAQAAGLKTGIYLYSYATTPEQAQQEANLVLQWIEGYTVNYPIVFDIEDKCHKNLSNQQLIDIINAFCTTIDAAGYYPMVYSYKNMFDTKLSICGWDRWVAQYNSSCGHTNNVCFWQYSSSGKVNGFSGGVDVNYQFKDYSNLIISDGFTEHNGNVRFYRNWKMQKGWVDFNDTRYYLDGAGNLVRGWYTEGDKTYYLTPEDGSIARGQRNVDSADFYFTAEGVKTAGWVVINDQKFFYEPANNGIMKRDWYSDEKGHIYFFDRTDGHMLTGAQAIDGVEFLFSAEGIRQTGWVTLENGTFFYDPATGAKVRGFYDDAAGRHYLSADDGHLVTGAATIEKKNYFFSPEGVMMTGIVETETGSCYYNPATGELVKNQDLNLNGALFHADKTGLLTAVEVPSDPAQTTTK